MINNSFVCDFKAYTSRSINKVRLLATCILKALKWYFRSTLISNMKKLWKSHWEEFIKLEVQHKICQNENKVLKVYLGFDAIFDKVRESY